MLIFVRQIPPEVNGSVTWEDRPLAGLSDSVPKRKVRSLALQFHLDLTWAISTPGHKRKRTMAKHRVEQHIDVEIVNARPEQPAVAQSQPGASRLVSQEVDSHSPEASVNMPVPKRKVRDVQ